ncbi:MAG: PKD domain-containing protein [Treponema sp.]|nr:PKD domain-containing protein [Treponema sp.]
MRRSTILTSILSVLISIFDKIKRLLSEILSWFFRNPMVFKIAGICIAALLGIGMTVLVCFALLAPESPPDSMISAMNRQMRDPVSSQFIVLPPEEKDWVLLSSFGENDEQTGAGTVEADRSKDFDYRIRSGETLSEIAYTYSIPFELLAYYNNISNANRVREGTIIKIPSVENQKQAALQMARQPRRSVAAAPTTRPVEVAFETRNSGNVSGAVTVHFSIVNPPAGTFQSFEWDFGDGRRGFLADPVYEYANPRTYVARLTARDRSGVIYRSSPLYIDVPHPGSAAEHSTTKFITLSSPDDYFVVNGTIIKVARYANVGDAPLDFSESDQYLTKVSFTKPGFYGLTVREASHPEQYYSVFVSPVPTMHSDAARGDFNWYRTQFNTGTTSNCGPASVSMAVGWSLGRYMPVSAVRQAVGWQGEGGTSLEELLGVIRTQGISAFVSPIRNIQNVRDVIDSGGIAIVLFHTSGVRTARGSPANDLFGKYYDDSVGHYIIIKGYSLNGDYLVVYDPIPSDWASNSFRYSDDVSMIGRNRYYATGELLRSLRRADMIVVPKAAL